MVDSVMEAIPTRKVENSLAVCNNQKPLRLQNKPFLGKHRHDPLKLFQQMCLGVESMRLDVGYSCESFPTQKRSRDTDGPRHEELKTALQRY
jgi:hypothetical protein